MCPYPKHTRSQNFVSEASKPPAGARISKEPVVPLKFQWNPCFPCSQCQPSLSCRRILEPSDWLFFLCGALCWIWSSEQHQKYIDCELLGQDTTADTEISVHVYFIGEYLYWDICTYIIHYREVLILRYQYMYTNVYFIKFRIISLIWIDG